MLPSLQYTPLWAFLILAFVALRGCGARFDQVLPLRKAALHPLMLCLWSIWRLLAADPLAVPVWLLAAACSLSLARRRGYPRGLQLDAPGAHVYVPGDPLAPLMLLGMFALHFGAELFRATHPHAAVTPLVLATLALGPGIVAGVATARLLALRAAVHRQRAARVAPRFS